MQVRRLSRKRFDDVYVAVQQNVAKLLNHGIWKMAWYSKGLNCREKCVKMAFRTHTRTHTHSSKKCFRPQQKLPSVGAESEFICWKQVNHTFF